MLKWLKKRKLRAIYVTTDYGREFTTEDLEELSEMCGITKRKLVSLLVEQGLLEKREVL